MSEALRKAALAGDAAAVKSLLSSGVEQLSHDGGESVTKLPPMLLQESDDAELGRYGYKLCRTALALASLHGHHEVVAMLQAHEEKDATGKTPLHLACQAGHLTVVRLLFERGCKAASRAPGKATLLHLAAGYGHSKLLAWMLEAKLFKNVDLKDSQGESALHLACSEADLDCMKLLLNNGADPNLADRSKQLPLQKFVGALRWVEEKPDGPTFSTHWGLSLIHI